MGGGGLAAAAWAFAKAFFSISPITFDLSDNGLRLLPLASDAPQFDLAHTGFARQTGWIGPGTGLLALDRNANGNIDDITELFGQSGPYADGYAALRTLDTNNDGQITAADAAFTQLRVWIDPNQDAIAQPGELKTLAELGIVSISLAAVATNQVIAGNTVKLTSTYTLINGTQRTVADVWFANSPTYTRPTTTVTLSSDVAALPLLNGYGTMRDVRSAAMSNAALKADLQALVANIGQAPALTLAAVEALMLDWSGSTTLDPNGRGGQMDARRLDFIEKYTGIPFLSATYNTSDPRWRAAIGVRQAWASAYDGIVARIVLQAGTMVPEFAYNQGLDFVLPTTTLRAALTGLYGRLGNLTAGNKDQWELALRVVDAFRMDARLPTASMLAEVAAATSDRVAAFASAIMASLTMATDGAGGYAITGVTENATIYAGPGISRITVTGGETVDSPSLADTVVFSRGDGHLTLAIADYTATRGNTLRFGPGIKPADVVARLDENRTLTLNDGSAGDEVILTKQFDIDPTYYGAPFGNPIYGHFYGVDAIRFDDGTTWTYADIRRQATTGTAAADVIHGTYEDDVYDGLGAPAGLEDFVDSVAGADTFRFNAGYGHLHIRMALDPGVDNGSVSRGRLLFGAGIAPAQVHVTSDASGTVFVSTANQGDRVEIDNMLNNDARGTHGLGIGTIQFGDGTIWSREQVLALVTTGTAASETLYGSNGDDTLDGRGGTDALYGRYGSDVFIFQRGYGSLGVYEDSGDNLDSTAKLRLGIGITPAQVTVTYGPNDSLVLSDGTPGDQVQIDRIRRLGYPTLGSHTQYGVGSVEFADGTKWDRAELLSQVTIIAGTSAADTLQGTNAANKIDGRGAPAGAQDRINGNGGDDSYVFGPGYGRLALTSGPASGGSTAAGRLVLQAGLRAERLWFARVNNDLLMQVIGTADRVTVTGWFDTSAGTARKLAAIAFADGAPGIGTAAIEQATSAMGTYQTEHPAFDPAAATALPNDPRLRVGLALAWDRNVAGPDPLFDAGFFLAHNGDVAAAGVDPYLHFLKYGWHEGRNPSANFDVSYYLSHNGDVAAAGLNPLMHYELYGWQEHRNPSATFSVDAYLDGNPDVRAAGTDPLRHYVQTGRAEGRPTYAVYPASERFNVTDVAAGTTSLAAGTAYTGPVASLQSQYIWAGSGAVAVAANVPNVFLHSGPAGDALAARGGSNVLDGGGGSNFLVGATGADHGTDTFFVDGTQGTETWSTIVNFHPGDLAVIFGFRQGTSTLAWSASEGAASYTGATLHSALAGSGTGVNASMTFAGKDLATLQSHLAVSYGTAAAQGNDYILLRYT